MQRSLCSAFTPGQELVVGRTGNRLLTGPEKENISGANLRASRAVRPSGAQYGPNGQHRRSGGDEKNEGNQTDRCCNRESTVSVRASCPAIFLPMIFRFPIRIGSMSED